MSDKPKRWTFENYTDSKNDEAWEKSNKYSELMEWTFHANDPLIEWLEKESIGLKGKIESLQMELIQLKRGNNGNI